jgi:hypothetical protein
METEGESDKIIIIKHNQNYLILLSKNNIVKTTKFLFYLNIFNIYYI